MLGIVHPRIDGIVADKEYSKACLVKCGEEIRLRSQVKKTGKYRIFYYTQPLSSTVTVRQRTTPPKIELGRREIACLSLIAQGLAV